MLNNSSFFYFMDDIIRNYFFQKIFHPAKRYEIIGQVNGIFLNNLLRN